MSQEPIFTDRETARTKLTEKIERERRLLADPHGFATIDPNWIIADAEWRLRWIDCAPDGANHQVAPLQDKRGVPMGGVYCENVGPSAGLRAARIKHGRHPISGEALAGSDNLTEFEVTISVDDIQEGYTMRFWAESFDHAEEQAEDAIRECEGESVYKIKVLR